MSYLKINQEKINAETKEILISLCPFNAFTDSNGCFEINAGCKMCKICINKGPAGCIELIEEIKEAINKDDWKGITVYVDHIHGEIHPVTFELIGKAKELAQKIKHPIYALFIGHNITKKAEELLYYGVDKIFVYDNKKLEDFVIEPYSNVFEDFIKNNMPSSVLVGATSVGRSLAPRIAARFKTGLTADCTILEMKENTDLVQIRPAFGGNIMAQIITENNRPQFCTVRYKMFSAPPKMNSFSGKLEVCSISEEKLESNIEVLSITKKEKTESISDAEVIIAVGRGVKNRGDIELIKNLAGFIGAKLACTRPLNENGWFDPRVQIGLSGRSVKPKLIIAIGISGSVQFAAGMQNSELIIAINNDPNAPIFNIAHHGIVGDYSVIIPGLIEKISQFNSSGGVQNVI